MACRRRWSTIRTTPAWRRRKFFDRVVRVLPQHFGVRWLDQRDNIALTLRSQSLFARPRQSLAAAQSARGHAVVPFSIRSIASVAFSMDWRIERIARGVVALRL